MRNQLKKDYDTWCVYLLIFKSANYFALSLVNIDFTESFA